MTKLELLAELEARSFVNMVVETTAVPTPDSANSRLTQYLTKYVESSELTAQIRKILILVIDEGEVEEVAYYRDKEPVSSVIERHPLAIKYATQIENVNGTVVSSGSNFIVVEGYQVSGDDMVKTTWFAKEVEGVLSLKKAV